jgi:two-component system, OmpR family, alkaline phosphatase synthesis response regulator PhoP
MDNIKTKVLIVDDDKFLLNMYSIKFSKNDYEVNAASSGEEVFSKIKEGYNPDIILLDVIMPGMDGFAVLERIKKENLVPNVLIIMLTNQGQLSDIEKAKEFGVNGYIIKATSIPSEVVEEVNRIYNSQKKHD